MTQIAADSPFYFIQDINLLFSPKIRAALKEIEPSLPTQLSDENFQRIVQELELRPFVVGGYLNSKNQRVLIDYYIGEYNGVRYNIVQNRNKLKWRIVALDILDGTGYNLELWPKFERGFIKPPRYTLSSEVEKIASISTTVLQEKIWKVAGLEKIKVLLDEPVLKLPLPDWIVDKDAQTMYLLQSEASSMYRTFKTCMDVILYDM